MYSLDRKKPFLGKLVHFSFTLLTGFIGFALANLVVVDLTTVQGSSMQPTLSNNDRLLIFKFERWIYGIIGIEYVPARGDIIVFQHELAGDEFLIKRVIGLPNERIVINKQALTVYNDEFPEGFKPDLTEELQIFDHDEYIDTFINHGEIFVIGDNHNASKDSRLFGNIKLADITGRLLMRTWPITNFKLFGQ